jgi:CheY-like chemotaxis protein
LVCKTWDNRVTTANSAEQALQFLAPDRGGARIDLVVTDYIMPGINGMEFLGALRQLSRSAGLFMTAYADTNWSSRRYATGATVFLKNPFSAAVGRRN